MLSEDLSRGFLDLIGELYEAALDPAKWRGIALGIAAFFDAESCLLQARDQEGGIVPLSVTENFTPEVMRDYVEHYHRSDEWANRALVLAPNTARLGEELISHGALANTPVFEILRRLGALHLVGAVVADESAPLGVIGVHRAAREFDAASRRQMQLLIPHLQRAFRVGCELGGERLRGMVGFDALDRLAVGALLVTGDGRLRFANRAASAMLRASDGLRAVGGRVGAAFTPTDERLRVLIAGAARTGSGAAGNAGGQLEPPRLGRRPLTALVSPVPAERLGLLADGGLAVLLVRDPVQPGMTDIGALRRLFGLTPAEARLAAALAEGDSLEEYAGAQQLSLHTVRTQLKRVMDKAATNRQSELVALILRSSATIRPG